MERRRPLPIGVDSFRKIRETEYYFMDKSELISDIVAQNSEVYLFTRPRRFGKSLNLSMMDCFFNIEYKNNKWFDGLKIMKHPEVVSVMNSFPVIRLDMKGLDVSSIEKFSADFSFSIQQLFMKFEGVLDPNTIGSSYNQAFEKGLRGELSIPELKNSLVILGSILQKQYGVPPVVLIDEYDNPINSAYGKRSYDDIIGFLRAFYTNTLKGNENLRFAVMTGVMQIAKETIFSGLNNLYVNNIFSKDYDERYGFTPGEVKDLCAYYGNPDAYDTAREWYDGYRFGDADIYNPWSLLNFIQAGFDPKPYWAGTSGNDIMETLLDHADDETYAELQELGNGGSVAGKDIVPTVAMKDISTDTDAIYSIMAMTGYLNAVPCEAGYALSVPNKEMYGVFSKAIATKGLNVASVKFQGFFDAAERNDIGMMESFAFSIFAQHFQDWDLPDEGAYRRIIAGAAMSRCGRYTVTTEGQSGNGRSDLVMRRNVPGMPNIVIEFKKSKADDPAVWESDAKGALEQIKKQEYFHSLEGRTILYGIAMFNKKAKVVSEEIDLRAREPYYIYA